MNRKLGEVLTGACLLLPGAQALAAEAPLCHAHEVTYFACTTGARERVAVCGGAQSVQVRLQSPGAAVTALPADGSQGPAELRYAHYWRPQVDYVNIAFEDELRSYDLFDRREGKSRVVGLEMRLKSSQDASTQWVCKGRHTGQLSRLKKVISCDRDNELNRDDCR